MEKICELCGKLFNTKIKTRRFCGYSCSNQVNAHLNIRNSKPKSFSCFGCGKKFNDYNCRVRTFCSRACFVKNQKTYMKKIRGDEK